MNKVKACYLSPLMFLSKLIVHKKLRIPLISPIMYIYQVIYMKIYKELYAEKVQLIYPKFQIILRMLRIEQSNLKKVKKEMQLYLKQDVSFHFPINICYSFFSTAIKFARELQLYQTSNQQLHQILCILKSSSSSPKFLKMIKPYFSLDLNSQKYTLILEAN